MNVMNVYKQRTTLQVIVVAGVGVLLGVGLLWISQSLARHSTWSALSRDLGSLVIVTICLSVLWELAAKRAFVAELMASTGLAQSIEQTGLVGLPRKWNEDIPWAKLLREARHLDIFVAYGTNWRGAYGDELIRFANRPETTCRVILPDPDNDAVVSAVACQFKREPALVRSRILEAAESFQQRFLEAGRPNACAVWFHPRPPLFSFFICGDGAVITLYKHNPDKPDVMGLQIRRGGRYFEFLEGEVERMLSDSREA